MLKVEKNIITKKSIKINTTLIAGYGIKAGLFISSKKRIFAGTSVYKKSENCTKTIKCQELKSGEIAYGELIITKQEKTELTLQEVADKFNIDVKNLRIKD